MIDNTFCISILQQACGFEYTSKLQRMFQDIGVSKDLNDKFKAHLSKTGPLDCKYFLYKINTIALMILN